MSESKLNSNLLKINGWIQIPKPLVLDHEYSLGLRVAVTDDGHRKSLHNGTHDMQHTAQVYGEAIISNDMGTRIMARAKGKNSQSQVLRWTIEQRWTDAGMLGDKEDFYTKAMSRIIDAVKQNKI